MIAISFLIMSSCAKPSADFVYKYDKKQVPVVLKFDNKSLLSERYEWDFGDGQKSNEVSPKHLFKSSGDFDVTLKAFKGNKSTIVKKSISLSPPILCLVEISTTAGNLILSLSDVTPIHRENFIENIELGLYNGLPFHRVINGFMIQAGDPERRKSGPTEEDKLLAKKTIKAEIVDTLIHRKGALAAARMPDEINPEKRSSAMQFYIVHGSSTNDVLLNTMYKNKEDLLTPSIRDIYNNYGGSPQLDGEYTVFGQLIDGFEILNKIATSATDENDNPIDEILILNINLIK